MAISLTPSLTSHQKGHQRRPGLTVTATNQRAGIDLLRWSRWYTGAEADAPNAAAAPSDGSLLRVRNDAGSIKTSRVTAPTSSSSYSTWTTTATGAAGTGVAIAALGTAALLLYVETGSLKLHWYYSTNSGSTWSDGGTLVTEASAIGSVALAWKSDGSACAFYTLGTSTTLKRLRRSTAGVWDASGTTWSKTGSVASITGVAATCSSGDYAILVTGTAATSTDRKTWMTTLGNGHGGITNNVWFGLMTISQADSLSTVSYSAPAAAYINADVHGFTTVKETGSVAFTRSYYTHSGAGFSNGLGSWLEPWPFEATGAYGIGLATFGDDVFATSPSGVWHATINQRTDLSDQVRSCSWEYTPTSASLTLELANNAAGIASLDGLIAGGQLTLTPGYYSGAAGAFEGFAPAVFSVDSVALKIGRGIGTISIKGSGPWERAERWHAPQAVQYAGTQTRDQLFTGLALRSEAAAVLDAGFHPPSSDFTSYSPQFAIASGETAATSLRRLLAVVTDYCMPDGISIRVRSTSASDTVDWALGAGDYPISALQLVDTGQRRNWVRVQGPDRYADAVTGADEYQFGGTIRVLRDLDASTDVKATAWAANAARRDYIEQEHGTLTAPYHAGIELLDIVSLTATELGLTTTSYRVIRLGMSYARDAKAPRFDTTLTLGGI